MNNNNDFLIGQRINTLLATNGIKQKELAKEIGVKDNIISYWCNGERLPNIKQIGTIAKFFNTSADYLLGLTNASTTDKNLAYFSDYTGLSLKTIESLNKRKNDIELEPFKNTSYLDENDRMMLLEDFIELFCTKLEYSILDIFQCSFTLTNECEKLQNEINIERNEYSNKIRKIISEYGAENVLNAFENENPYTLTDNNLSDIEELSSTEEMFVRLNSVLYVLQDEFNDFIKEIADVKSAKELYHKTYSNLKTHNRSLTKITKEVLQEVINNEKEEKC